jgi:DNA polymerase (family 10)
MDKHEAARILEEIALYLEIEGENPFKVRAYHNAAKALEGLNEDLLQVVQEKRLEEIPGIGERIAKKITALVNKGELPYYKKLKQKLKITSIEELTQACQEGKVAELAGFGEKTQSNILRSINRLKIYGRRVLWWHACRPAYSILDKLLSLKDVQKAEVAGSFRRKLETIGDLDFIVASPNAQKIMDWFTRQASVMMIQAKGPTKSSVRLKGGIQADLRVVPLEQFPYALLYFTGSKDFNISLRQRANHLGYTLNEYDLSPLEGTKKRRKACASEADIFQALKLEYIPPELREGYGEIEAAERGKLPVLVEEGDIRGIFHCHTTDSDGHNTLQEMAEEAQKLGWEYLGISDHSKASYQANGMDEERLFAQMQKIDTLNRSGKYSVHLFAGLECDILADGTLDFSDDILKELDFVIISAHRRYKQDEKTLTSRLIRAIENPYSTMVGHLTGRLLLHREPSPVNVPKVIDACIANHKIIELNAHPYRLDMDWRFWHQAAEKGAMCCINPDAHSTDELRYYVAGIQVARKGWLEKRHVLNTQSLLKIKKNLNNK